MKQKKTKQKNNPGTGEFHQTFKKEENRFYRNFFKDRLEKNSLYEYSSSLSKDQRKRLKINSRPISMMNTETKILNKILAMETQKHIKRIVYHDQVFNLRKTSVV